MVDHFSDSAYVHLMRIKIQEESLAYKSAFEIWAAILGVKIHLFHADNGRFAEEPFR